MRDFLVAKRLYLSCATKKRRAKVSASLSAYPFRGSARAIVALCGDQSPNTDGSGQKRPQSRSRSKGCGLIARGRCPIAGAAAQYGGNQFLSRAIGLRRASGYRAETSAIGFNQSGYACRSGRGAAYHLYPAQVAPRSCHIFGLDGSGCRQCGRGSRTVGRGQAWAQ